MANSEAAAQAEEDDLQAILDAWRDVPDLPPPQRWVEVAREQPFTFEETEPVATEPNVAWAQLVASMEHQVPTVAPTLAAPALVVSGGALLGIVAGFGAAIVLHLGELGLAVTLAFILAASTCAAWLRVRTKAQARLDRLQKLNAAAKAAWGAHWAGVEGTDHECSLAWADRREVAAVAWKRAEHERVTWLHRLMSGDVDAIGTCLSESLGDLDFPFDATCRVGVADEATAYLLIDLPEIGEVIPETRIKILKNGNRKDVKRPAAERNAAWADLACGIGLHLARHAFTAAPTLEYVHIAAYTQRQKRGTVNDAFVYEFKIGRSTSGRLDHAREDALARVQGLGARIKPTTTLMLSAVPAPEWANDIE